MRWKRTRRPRFHGKEVVNYRRAPGAPGLITIRGPVFGVYTIPTDRRTPRAVLIRYTSVRPHRTAARTHSITCLPRRRVIINLLIFVNNNINNNNNGIDSGYENRRATAPPSRAPDRTRTFGSVDASRPGWGGVSGTPPPDGSSGLHVRPAQVNGARVISFPQAHGNALVVCAHAARVDFVYLFFKLPRWWRCPPHRRP